MQVTLFTDYSLRVLLFLGHKKSRSKVEEISAAFHISRNHLVKVVHHLAREGYIVSHRGKNGGIELAVSPSELNIGDFFLKSEKLDLLECFDVHKNTCPIIGVCSLQRALQQAQSVFVESLRRYTLADFLVPNSGRTQRMKLLGLKDAKL